MGLALALGAGCGAASGSYAYQDEASGGYPAGPPAEPGYAGGAPATVATGDMAEAEPMAMEDSGGGGGDWDSDYRFESDEVERVEDQTRIAQATPQPQNQTGNQPQQGGGQQPARQATDARSGPLLIYTAQITLAVYEVEQTQDRLIESLAALEGFVSQRTDQQIVLRVPAEKFEQALRIVEEGGDVLNRNVQAQDVGEEFRDLAIRIRNHEAMRDRLEALLARASDVQGALAIERELERITGELESMKGRQRYLADQIAFSTITVFFQPLSTEPTSADGFLLPFTWLNELGLSTLMRL